MANASTVGPRASRGWHTTVLAGVTLLATVLTGSIVSAQSASPANGDQPLAGKRIGVSMCCQVGILDFFVENIQNAAAHTDRGETITVVNAGGDPQKQITDVENFIGQGFDAVMTTEQNGEGWEQVVSDAHSKGIIFTNHSAPANTGADINIVYPHYDSGYINGVDAANWLIANQNSVGEAGISIFPDNEGLLSRSTGFEDGLKSVLPDITIWEANASGDIPGGASSGANLLQAHPDIKIMYGWNEEVALGMLQAAAEAGRTDPASFYIGTPDATPQSFEKILDGTPIQTVGAPAFAFTSTLWTFLTERALMGEKIPPTGVINVKLVNKDNAQAQIDAESNPLAPENQALLFEGLRLYDQAVKFNDPLPTGDPIEDYFGSPPQP